MRKQRISRSSDLKPGQRHVPLGNGIYGSCRKDGTVVYEVRVTNVQGKQVYETVGTSYAGAKARRDALRMKVNAGENPPSASVTIGDLIRDWKEHHEPDLRERTIEVHERNVRLYIEPTWGRVKARDVTVLGVERWHKRLKKQDGSELKGGTKTLIVSTFALILDYGIKAGAVSNNPVRLIDKNTRPTKAKESPFHVIEDAELGAIIAAAAARPWFADIVVVARYTGLRLGEVCGLDFADVDFENETILVKGNLGRNGKVGPCKGDKTGAGEEIEGEHRLGQHAADGHAVSTATQTETQAEVERLRAAKAERDGLDEALAAAEKAAKAEQIEARRKSAELRQTYANRRSRVENMRETLLQAQVDATDAKESYDRERAETLALERELAWNGIEIAERLASEEARFYTSVRLRHFTNRFKRVFANGQIV